MKVVIAIPTYNERDNIGNTVKTLNSVISQINKANVHILVIDDSSPDGTSEKVRELIKTNSNLHLLVRKEKNGLGAAYKSGFEYIFETMDADAVITFDADLSHDPNVIKEMVEKFVEGEEFISATRYRKGGGIPPEWGIHRKMLSYGGNLFVKTLYFDSGVSDFTSGFKLLSKNVYKDILEELEAHEGYTLSISTNIQPIRKGYKVYEIPYHFTDRTIGESKMGPEYLFNALSFIVKLRIEDFLSSRLGKVIFAGALGTIAQLLSFGLLFQPLIEQRNILNLPGGISLAGINIELLALIALLLSIEIGIFVSFYINNKWAFKDHKLNGVLFWLRFLKNHLVVLGAIVIQLISFQALVLIFGRNPYLDYVYQAIGILLGLVWNFYFYKKIIWKVNK